MTDRSTTTAAARENLQPTHKCGACLGSSKKETLHNISVSLRELDKIIW